MNASPGRVAPIPTVDRPGARPFVEPPRPRRVAHVGSDLAGQAEAQVVLGLNDMGDRGEDRWLVTREPDQLRRDEPGHRLDADDVGKRSMAFPQFGRLAVGAPVVVKDRRPQRLAVAADEHCAVHLAGETDRFGAGEGLRRGASELAERADHRRDPGFGILLRPQRPRTIGAVRARRRGDQPSPRFHQHGLEARRAAIDADRDHRQTVAEIDALDKRRGTRREDADPQRRRLPSLEAPLTRWGLKMRESVA